MLTEIIISVVRALILALLTYSARKETKELPMTEKVYIIAIKGATP